jgi:hypothetical protein
MIYQYCWSQSHLLTLVLPSGPKAALQQRLDQEILPTNMRKTLWSQAPVYVTYLP